MFEPSLPNPASTLVTILKMDNSGNKMFSPYNLFNKTPSPEVQKVK
jgi:hypothetical protein